MGLSHIDNIVWKGNGKRRGRVYRFWGGHRSDVHAGFSERGREGRVHKFWEDLRTVEYMSSVRRGR